MARTHTFKGSASGWGYFAYIEDGQLVIGEDWGREGGILYKGPYSCADVDKHMLMLSRKAPKLYNSIITYYAGQAGKEVAALAKAREAKEPNKEPYYVRYRFKDSRDSSGNGYSGYINTDGLLIIEHDEPRGGGVRFEGKYEDMSPVLAKLLVELRANDPVLYDDIEKYFTKHGVKDKSDRKDLGGSKVTKYTVRLFLNNSKEIVAVIPGTSETDVIRKIMLPVPDTVMMYDLEGRTMAVRSDKIYTVAILD